jgi:hypothetical protein
MKQSITKEQWEEINKSLVSREWRTKASELNEYPNIGQMIDFIGDDLDSILHSTRYVVQIEILKIIQFQDLDLVNALWEAVKDKIKKI